MRNKRSPSRGSINEAESTTYGETKSVRAGNAQQLGPSARLLPFPFEAPKLGFHLFVAFDTSPALTASVFGPPNLPRLFDRQWAFLLLLARRPRIDTGQTGELGDAEGLRAVCSVTSRL